MISDKDSVVEVISCSVRELQEEIDRHCGLIASILAEKGDGRAVQPLRASGASIPRELYLKQAIKEAIDTLEESRKAFKSKRLEALRKMLTQVLIDAK